MNAEMAGLLRLMFGPAPVPALTADECRWEDDGGAQRPAQDGYVHLFNTPVDTVTWHASRA